MKNKARKNKKRLNMKIFPIYKMLSWDLLFYYSISFLFLTQVKCFSVSEVFISETGFILACVLLQIPAGRVIDKIGKKNSLIIGNISIVIYVASLFFINNMIQLVIGYVFWALGYTIKGICESNILYDSLPTGRSRGKLYANIDSTAVSLFYYFDAFSCLIAGFVYAVNPYLPLVFCLIISVISTLLSCMFYHTKDKSDDLKISISLKAYLKDLKKAFKYVKKSKRIFCLITFFTILSSIFYMNASLRGSMLNSLELKSEYFGIICAIMQVIAAIFSKKQDLIKNKFKNKTLAFIGIPVAVSYMVIGFVALCGNAVPQVIIIIAFLIIQSALKGPYWSIIGEYLNNFTNRGIRAKLSIIKNLTYSLTTAILSLFIAYLMEITNPKMVYIILGCIYTIAIILILDYMKKRVGLRPEEYPKEDIKYDSKPNKVKD